MVNVWGDRYVNYHIWSLLIVNMYWNIIVPVNMYNYYLLIENKNIIFLKSRIAVIGITSCGVMSSEFLLSDEKVLKRDRGDSCTTLQMYSMLLNCIFKNCT